MIINKLAITGLASVAIAAAAASPALACDHKPAQKPAVHQTVVTHKTDCDHKIVVQPKPQANKDCDHTVVTPKPVEKPKTDCDHKTVEQPKPAPKPTQPKTDCDHKVTPGKGSTTTPAPKPQPEQPAVLSATTQPTTLPQTGANDLSLLIGLPSMAVAAGGYIRAKRQK
ncbi:MAG TPA: LPXTG cell wall anchor domain-containing protein [Candidatus Saccharimonadia bacterium]|jgi:LPXTG-motif cell wall-anchored protein